MLGIARNNDVLDDKRKMLDTYAKQFDYAVSMMTGAIDSLTNANNIIDTDIKDVDEYRAELEATAEKLKETKARNETVIKNFGALLGMRAE